MATIKTQTLVVLWLEHSVKICWSLRWRVSGYGHVGLINREKCSAW